MIIAARSALNAPDVVATLTPNPLNVAAANWLDTAKAFCKALVKPLILPKFFIASPASTIELMPWLIDKAACTFSNACSVSLLSIPNKATAPVNAEKPPATVCNAPPKAANLAPGLNNSTLSLVSFISSLSNATFLAAANASSLVSPNFRERFKASCCASRNSFFMLFTVCTA